MIRAHAADKKTVSASEQGTVPRKMVLASI